ncbi:MAG: HD domain-containing protein [Bacilli bacterium]|nr:HD domain-containing protein [Bacilli bacterium]
MYEKIVMDEEYIAFMKQIEAIHFVSNGKWDWEHGLAHAVRVSHYVRQFLTDLKEDENTIEMGRVAALLHDIGLVDGIKEGHAKKSAEKASMYLNKYSIDPAMKQTIIDAIADHSSGKKMESSIGAALFLADKLDMAYHRVVSSTIKDSINTAFMKVKRVEFVLTEEELCVEYSTEPDFDMGILKCWKKALTAPLMVSAYFHRNCIFKKNKQNIDVQKILEE